jgi:low temperature requirement protein LtrA
MIHTHEGEDVAAMIDQLWNENDYYHFQLIFLLIFTVNLFISFFLDDEKTHTHKHQAAERKTTQQNSKVLAIITAITAAITCQSNTSNTKKKSSNRTKDNFQH